MESPTNAPRPTGTGGWPDSPHSLCPDPLSDLDFHSFVKSVVARMERTTKDRKEDTGEDCECVEDDESHKDVRKSAGTMRREAIYFLHPFDDEITDICLVPNDAGKENIDPDEDDNGKDKGDEEKDRQNGNEDEDEDEDIVDEDIKDEGEGEGEGEDEDIEDEDIEDEDIEDEDIEDEDEDKEEKEEVTCVGCHGTVMVPKDSVQVSGPWMSHMCYAYDYSIGLFCGSCEGYLCHGCSGSNGFFCDVCFHTACMACNVQGCPCDEQHCKKCAAYCAEERKGQDDASCSDQGSVHSGNGHKKRRFS